MKIEIRRQKHLRNTAYTVLTSVDVLTIKINQLRDPTPYASNFLITPYN
jgi:hypothetical protein